MSLWKRQPILLIPALIAILLVVLGVLQYRWVGELSEFERRRMQNSLQAASERFRSDFNRELSNVWDTFHVRRNGDVAKEITEGYTTWVSSFPFPELIDAVFWVSTEGGAPAISQFNLLENRIESSVWPSQLAEMRDEFRRELQRRNSGRHRRAGSYLEPLGDDLLALVIAQRELATLSWTVVMLRGSVLVEQVVPARIREYFGGGGELDYDVWIIDETDNGRVAYASDPAAAPFDLTEPDIQIELRGPDYIDVRRGGDSGEHLWSVFLKHRAGSLEAAVGQIRRRNLMVSLGVLALLGVSVVVLVVATRRAQSLADQQVEFVAGVSHELRTPITGISSLSQNLADGVVQTLGQAQTYGEAIHRESRRLADMIERVLRFSAMRSKNRRYELRPIVLIDLIDEALDSLGIRLSQRFHFEKEIADTLPPILADERALRSAIVNLISNAMKFSDEMGLVRLSARVVDVRDRSEIQLSVEDHGSGIPPVELPHIFKPFYRGRSARADQVEGSGLGLSLVKEVVEAHGGNVTAASNPGAGSTFTIHLPVAEAGTLEAERDDDLSAGE